MSGWRTLMPRSAPSPTTPQNAFILLDNELAVVETFLGESLYHAEEAAAYANVMDNLAQPARELIISAGEALRRAPPAPAASWGATQWRGLLPEIGQLN